MINFRDEWSLGSYAGSCFRIALLALLFTFSACSGGGGGSSLSNTSATAASADSGEITIALTDAEGDFESYVVDVDYLRGLRCPADGECLSAMIHEVEKFRRLFAGGTARKSTSHGRVSVARPGSTPRKQKRAS